MKKNCRHCHFLAKEYRDESGHVYTTSLSKEERKMAETNPGDLVKDHYSLNCHMGVWDEGVAGSKEERNETINLVPRNSGCFFFPHHAAMLFPAAQELQRRAEENSQLKRSNMYTRIGLWVATGALAVSALVEAFKSG
ncbi:MAG: hypothetical protein P8179_22950 [Candidatus Thiodiazotropha sp.]